MNHQDEMSNMKQEVRNLPKKLEAEKKFERFRAQNAIRLNKVRLSRSPRKT